MQPGGHLMSYDEVSPLLLEVRELFDVATCGSIEIDLSGVEDLGPMAAGALGALQAAAGSHGTQLLVRGAWGRTRALLQRERVIVEPES